MLERHPSDTVVRVGHGAANRSLLMQLLDQPLSAYWRLTQDPCGLTEIDIDQGPARARRINETAHLET